jgi:thiol-disulfide isomerase/thioredoxin
MKPIQTLIICFALLAGSVNGKFSHKKHTTILKRLPEIEIYNLANKHTTLGKIAKNKITVIDCWFIPCPPCFREMELMHELYSKYKDSKDVQVISLCRSDTMVVKRFLNNNPGLATFISWFHKDSKLQHFALPIYFIPGCNERIFINDKKFPPKAADDKTKCPDQIFHFKGYPTVIIADRQGKILYQKTGYLPEWKASIKKEMEQSIQEALK